MQRAKNFHTPQPWKMIFRNWLMWQRKNAYYDQLSRELKELENKIQASKSSDLANYKSEIMNILQEQIGFHYDLYEGQAEVTLEHDKAIIEARKVLNDSLRYNKLLSAN